MKNLLFILLFGLLISLSSCRSDFNFQPSNGGLEFSKDTVYLDTVFTNIGSSTYRLKVYNKSGNDISIPKIQLAKGTSSKYRMMIDGMTGEDVDASGFGEGKIFNNVELLAKDSMYIFIETTASITDANPTDFLYTDKIEFHNISGAPQTVDLVTLIQDAYFLYPKKFADGTTETLPIGDDEVYGFYLDENDPINGNEFIWTNDKPYVIYGYAAVPSTKTLTINPGARVHFHDNSGLIVGSGGTLKVNGTLSTTEALENEIIFEGDRLEPGFANVPGQWSTVWLTSGSTNNEINHLTIKNSVVGLLIDSNDGNYMTINNTQIYNSSNIGLYAKTAKIKGENIVINSAGQYALACTLGGFYEFKHCTFNNNWPSSKQLAVLVNNFYTDDSNTAIGFNLQQADFYNCIIHGSNQIELFFDKNSAGTWTTPLFNKCQIKFNNTNNQYSDNTDYSFLNDVTNIIKNGTTDFTDLGNNNLSIGADSDAIGFGIATSVPFDILGNPRTTSIDLGAYQYVP